MTTRGEKVCQFIERYCLIPEGSKVGQPIKLLDFQRNLILDVYDNPAGTSRVCYKDRFHDCSAERPRSSAEADSVLMMFGSLSALVDAYFGFSVEIINVGYPFAGT